MPTMSNQVLRQQQLTELHEDQVDPEVGIPSTLHTGEELNDRKLTAIRANADTLISF